MLLEMLLTSVLALSHVLISQPESMYRLSRELLEVAVKLPPGSVIVLCVQRVPQTKHCVVHSLQERLVDSEVGSSVGQPAGEPGSRVWWSAVSVGGEEEHTYPSFSSCTLQLENHNYNVQVLPAIGFITEHKMYNMCTKQSIVNILLYLLSKTLLRIN